MFLIFSLFLTISNLTTETYYEKGKAILKQLEYTNQLTKKDKDFLKKIVSEVKHQHVLLDKPLNPSLETSKCIISSNYSHDVDTPLYVFVSFSLSNEIWSQLSQELEKTGGTFVLRGLPDNSFEDFAAKIYSLRKQGVNANIQVDPRLFQKFKIENVPSFVTIHGEDYDKISGNISLKGALERLPNKTAKILKDLL